MILLNWNWKIIYLQQKEKMYNVYNHIQSIIKKYKNNETYRKYSNDIMDGNNHYILNGLKNYIIIKSKMNKD